MPRIEMILEQLALRGMLLKQDPSLPSVVGMVTGESLRGSWWSHPHSHEIFSVLNELADHPDVLLTKLVKKKDTLVYRSLWPELMAVGSARAAWQMTGISNQAKTLLDSLEDSNRRMTSLRSGREGPTVPAACCRAGDSYRIGPTCNGARIVESMVGTSRVRYCPWGRRGASAP